MCHGRKRELTTKSIQNKGPSSKYAPTTQKPTHHKPNEIRHNYARMCRLPPYKKVTAWPPPGRRRDPSGFPILKQNLGGPEILEPHIAADHHGHRSASHA